MVENVSETVLKTDWSTFGSSNVKQTITVAVD